METVNEVFKDMPSYEGLYQVSNYGNVKSFKRYSDGRLLAPCLSSSGYLGVVLCKDNKKITKAVHKLMQSVFELGMGFVDHINGIKTDNCLENLRVVTSRQNTQNLECHRNGKLVGANYRKDMAHLKKPWQSRIQINGKTMCLGYFATELESHEVYMEKANQLDKG